MSDPYQAVRLFDVAVAAGKDYLAKNPGEYMFARVPIAGSTQDGLFPTTFPYGETHSQYITYTMSKAIGGYGAMRADGTHPSPTDVNNTAILQAALGQVFAETPWQEGPNGTVVINTAAPAPTGNSRSFPTLGRQ